jgi:hypothetical protein
MSYKGILQVGIMRVEVTASSDRELFEKASFLAELPRQCQNCEAEKMVPNYRSPQGNDYYAMVCGECGWRYKIGITKEGRTLFPKREWEPPYRDGEQEQRHEEARPITAPVATNRPATGPQRTQQASPEEIDRRRNEQYTSGERSYPPSTGHGRAYGK